MKKEKELKELKKLNEDELAQVIGGQGSVSESLTRLSNGMTINSSADDPSGYQISERMRVQIRSSDT